MRQSPARSPTSTISEASPTHWIPSRNKSSPEISLVKAGPARATTPPSSASSVPPSKSTSRTIKIAFSQARSMKPAISSRVPATTMWKLNPISLPTPAFTTKVVSTSCPPGPENRYPVAHLLLLQHLPLPSHASMQLILGIPAQPSPMDPVGATVEMIRNMRSYLHQGRSRVPGPLSRRQRASIAPPPQRLDPLASLLLAVPVWENHQIALIYAHKIRSLYGASSLQRELCRRKEFARKLILFGLLWQIF